MSISHWGYFPGFFSLWTGSWFPVEWENSVEGWWAE